MLSWCSCFLSKRSNKQLFVTLWLAPQVVKAAVSDLWYDKLTSVQEFWNHASTFNWAIESVYNHCWFLAATLSTTKFTLEEVLAAMQDKSRLAKHNNISAHRMYFQHSFCSRLMQSQLGNGFVKLQPADILEAKSHTLTARSFHAYEIASASSQVLSKAKTFLGNLKPKEGQGRSTTSTCLLAHSVVQNHSSLFGVTCVCVFACLPQCARTLVETGW